MTGNHTQPTPRARLAVAGAALMLAASALGTVLVLGTAALFDGEPARPAPAGVPVPPPASGASSRNPVHVDLCGRFKDKADDPTRTDAARAAAQAEYDARCADVKG